jgi:DNA polymerase-1
MNWNIDTPAAEYFGLDHPNLNTAITALVTELKDQKTIAIDTETTGLVVWKDLPLYWSLAWGQRRVTLNAALLPWFKELFEKPDIDWVFANAKYDAHILANVGVTFAGRLVDIQVMHALLYEERSHSLKDIAEHILGWRWNDFQDTFGKIGKKNSAEDVIRRAERENFQLLVEYAANDSWGTLGAYIELKKQLEAANTYSLFTNKPPYINTLWCLFDKIEVPFTKVLWNCERNGIKVNLEYMGSIAPGLKTDIQQLEREVAQEAGFVLNPNSPDQLRKYFFDKLKLSPLRVTKGGKSGVRKPSTDARFLEHYADKGVKMAELLLKHRDLSKLYGTYVVGLQEHTDPTGRIHTRFNQDVARTGRLSSAGPNMQNIPRPDNDRWKLRGAFVPEPGNVLIVADYEQLEMRLLACASLEPGMIEVIHKGWDIHMGNASMIFGIPYDEIKLSKDIDKKVKSGDLPPSAMTQRVQECLDARAAAKTLGFGLVYGMGPDKLANSLKITRPQAEAKLSQFKQTYPAVDKFAKESVLETEQTGYAFTVMGRRRNVPQIVSPRKDERMQAERIAVNTPIQGSAADVVKCAQILCFKAGLERKYDAKMLLQVHDELVFECPKEAAEDAKAEIKEWMEHPFYEDLAVPLKVDIGSGESWLHAK